MRPSRSRSLHVTLLALPLLSDATTSRIVSCADVVVNVPSDPAEARRLINQLGLDVLLFPDWQPFPDSQALLFQQQRLAPVQVCFFVRGSSCAGGQIDYYWLPTELQESYLLGQSAGQGALGGASSRGRGKAGKSGAMNSKSRDLPRAESLPSWAEGWAEQVVLVNLPLLTGASIRAMAAEVLLQAAAAANGSSSTGKGTGTGAWADADTGTAQTLDLDGQIYFQGQPVALVPAHPSQLHPAMDEILLKLLQATASLHVVLVLPEQYFSYGLAAAPRHKAVWARHLVRRLWAKAGSLSHRVRLLAAPVSHRRFLQLASQADVVLDTFPFGVDSSLLALALSVGTPVVTLASGAAIELAPRDTQEVRALLSQELVRARHAHNAVFRALVRGQSLWRRQVSSVEGFYRRIDMESLSLQTSSSSSPSSSPSSAPSFSFSSPSHSLSPQLVAANVSAYFQLAAELLADREKSYALRVRLLESVDGQVIMTSQGTGTGTGTGTGAGAGAGAGAGGVGATSDHEEPALVTAKEPDTSAFAPPCRGLGSDVTELLLRVGTPWARLRDQVAAGRLR